MLKRTPDVWEGALVRIGAAGVGVVMFVGLAMQLTWAQAATVGPLACPAGPPRSTRWLVERHSMMQ